MNRDASHVSAIGEVVASVALMYANSDNATFDQLAEEVLELHLALRGKHRDTPELELLEIASIAINMLADRDARVVHEAYLALLDKRIMRGGEQ